jgi:hypothetical protein
MQATRISREIDNLGIPPLAGVCSYEEAAQPGLSVEETVRFLKRFAYVTARLNKLQAAHLARTPEWEVKSAFGLHLWLDAEHATMLRGRVAEMRQPPLGLDKVPDERLEAWIDEAIRAGGTAELLAAIYRVIRPELVRSARSYLAASNPLLDYPTRRLFNSILVDEDEMIAWGEAAIGAVADRTGDEGQLDSRIRHLNAYLAASGGIFEDGAIVPDGPFPPARGSGQPFVMDPEPARDDRFVEQFNRGAPIDAVYADTERPAAERVLALLAKRLREMDVPEWMAPIIYKTEGKPWDYYLDLSRQLWDETRHAMMGEVGFVRAGVPFYRYPINMTASQVLNTEFAPIESHVILWAIEQSLMARKTGKGYEWDVAVESGDPFAISVQDYDWADEVLHAQIGRRWLMPDIGSQAQLKTFAEPVIERWRQAVGALVEQHRQEDWWPAFMAEVEREANSGTVPEPGS